MASTTANFEMSADRSRDSKGKKRRKIENVNRGQAENNQIRWRSVAEQQTYSSKLVEALRHVLHTSPPTAVSSRSRAVRETADKILAIAAKGRTRWSRAILTTHLKLRLKNHKKAKTRSKMAAAGTSRLNKTAFEVNQKRLPALQRRVRVLGRLVPGCRKLSFPNILEEATNYISALEMQVRAMASIADLLTGSSAVNFAESSIPLEMGSQL